MKRLKILWFSHLVPYPPKGGVLQRSYHLAKEVAKFHDVYFLAFHQKNLLAPFYESDQIALAESELAMREFCVDFKAVPVPCDQYPYGSQMLALKSLVTRDCYTMAWLKSQVMEREFKGWIGKHDFDLIHYDTISLAPYYHRFASNIPASLGHHNIESHMLLRRGRKSKGKLASWFYRQEGERLKRYEQEMAINFNVHITCSELDSRRLENIYTPQRVESIPNGVDIDYFKPINGALKQRIIFIGTMNWYPNIEAASFLIHKLWPKLKAINECLELDIVGANPPKQLLDVAKSDASIHVHGFVDDIRPMMDQAAVYVCPIDDGGGTKLKVLDALSMGKAIVAHPVACEGIPVEQGRSVMFAESPEEYVKAIVSLLEDEKKARELGHNGRRLIEDGFSFSALGKQMAIVFSETAG